MKIVIVGDGKVGYTLADYLSKEPHDVTIVDRNTAALNRAGDTLDVMCVRGNGANVATLVEAGVSEADMLIAVTTSDETNMVCCLMGKKLGVKYTIARIRDPEYTDSLQMLQKELGIDMVINPERAAAIEISRLFRHPFATNLESFASGRVEMVEFRLEEDDELNGLIIAQAAKRFPKLLFAAVERDGEAIIPDGEFVFKIDDKIHVMGEVEPITQFFKRLGRSTRQVRSAILVGGGHISHYLAQNSKGTGIALKIIEIKQAKCEALSESLGSLAEIVLGDGTERELLEGENLRDMDALVCLTDRDEENLIVGLYGVNSGVPKVIVKVNRLNYLEFVSNLGVDSIISPKYTTANAILRQVRAMDISQHVPADRIYRLVNAQVEAQEYTVPKGAGYIGVPLHKLGIKKGVIVAIIVRDRKVIIPFGRDHIEAGDAVVLISRVGFVHSFEDALLRNG